MMKDIYDPLSEYVNVYRDRFRAIAKETFAELAAEAKVDVEANRKTCSQIYAAQQVLGTVSYNYGVLKIISILLCVGVVAGACILIFMNEDLSKDWLWGIGVAMAVAVVLVLVVLFPSMKKMKRKQKGMKDRVRALKRKAWKQMEQLNQLYDWDVLTRMMSKTVPRLEFDPYFTTQRLADLMKTYGWDGSFNRGRSVIYSHSGLINGNPFVICRTRKMEMGTKIYYGSKTIYWTTRERDADGRLYTRNHSETLTASVKAPYPSYYEATRLIYGNTAAPDLIFHRKQSGLANKVGSLSFWWNRRSLRSKARDLEDSDYAMLTNEDFEVAFDTSDRNNNQQYALLFTPLAQESMMKLLQDKEVGYGDDFDFIKRRMINTIIPEHMQSIDLDMNPHYYHSFDYVKAEKNFYNLNASYFRAIYFALAPLLCVPMYQQIRSHENIYGRDMERHSSFWEHEALANFWGQEHFEHPSCVTDCILKTEVSGKTGDTATLKVFAHGYRAEQRVEYIRRHGRDGRWHHVPVYWDEYIPVTGVGHISIREDNHVEDENIKHRDRLKHISDVLESDAFDNYRRHIASKI